MMRQRPGRPGGGRDRHAHRQSATGEGFADILEQQRLAAEQMRHRGDVDQQAIGRIERGPWPQRRAHSASCSRKARSPAGSEGAVAMAGHSVRASASIMPRCAPAAAAICVTASIRGPCAVSEISTSGASASARACSPITSRQRSIASEGNQIDRMRRGARRAGAPLMPAAAGRWRSPAVQLAADLPSWSAARAGRCAARPSPPSPSTHSPGACARARNRSARQRGAPGACGSSAGRATGPRRSPSASGRRTGRVRRRSDEEQRHAVAFARQRQPPRSGEVERAGIARDLAQHESEVAAPQPSSSANNASSAFSASTWITRPCSACGSPAR